MTLGELKNIINTLSGLHGNNTEVEIITKLHPKTDISFKVVKRKVYQYNFNQNDLKGNIKENTSTLYIIK